MNHTTVFIYESRFGSIRFALDSPFWIEDSAGFSSVDIDIASSQSADQVGAGISAQTVKPRSFTMNGTITSPVEQNRRRMIEVMAPQEPATLTYKQGGESWYLDVVPERTPDISGGTDAQSFQVRLYADYPYWRTTAMYTEQIAGLNKLFKFPFFTGGRWYITRYDEVRYKEIVNTGNVSLPFKLVFSSRAEVQTPEVVHTSTRQIIKINKLMVAGEQVVVDTQPGRRGVTVLPPGGEPVNGFRYLTTDSDLKMVLLPGVNLLRADAAENKEAISVRIETSSGVISGV